MRSWIIISCLLLFGWNAQANVVGADTQNFNPVTNGLDFVTVHSSETLEPGLLNLGLFLNYAVNSLPEYEGSSGASRTNFRDALLSSDFNLGFGILRNWDIGLSFPAVLNQNVDSDVTLIRGEFAATGLTEMRANSKYRWFGDQSGGLATILSVNFNMIEDNPFTGTGAGPTFNIEGAYDWTYNLINMAVNLGYRARSPGDAIPGILVEPLPNQWIGSVAASYLFPEFDTKLIGEIFASIPTKSQENATARSLSSMELLVGVKSDVNRQWAWHAGVGTELLEGTASPDWRVYSGVNVVLGPLWRSADDLEFYRVDENENVVTALTEENHEEVFRRNPPKVETFVIKDVLFETASAKINPAFEKRLRELVNYLNKPPGYQSVVIEGHTDSVGSGPYNLDLSKRRANSVRLALIGMGVPSSKIRGIGYGESRPIADNGNFQGRALNRRVEFQIRR